MSGTAYEQFVNDLAGGSHQGAEAGDSDVLAEFRLPQTLANQDPEFFAQLAQTAEQNGWISQAEIEEDGSISFNMDTENLFTGMQTMAIVGSALVGNAIGYSGAEVNTACEIVEEQTRNGGTPRRSYFYPTAT